MARALLVVGNWKMHKTAREAADYLERLAPKIEGHRVRVFLATSYTSIAPAAACAQPLGVSIGAQNMNDARDGAFTGEVAALMLKEAGASFVILGHSERRRIFGETDEFIHRKVLRAIRDDLQPIICVGETLQEREKGQTEEVLQRQIDQALQDVTPEEASRLILAYEPVWAIGTGMSATAKQAQEAHAQCRSCLARLFGKRKANQVPILYGGSVTLDNVKELVSEEDVDGVLVGGASLDVDTFAAIVQTCEEVR